MTAWVVYGSKVAGALVGFATSIVIARVLGPDGRADYFIASTVGLGVFAVCHLSVDQSIFWALAERRAPVARIVKAITPLAFVAAAVATALYWAVGFLGGFFNEVPNSTAFAGMLLAPVLVGRLILDTFLYASDRARVASLSLVLTAILQLAGIGALAAVGDVTSATVIVVSAASTFAGGLPNAAVVAQLSSGFRTMRPLDLRPLMRVGLSTHLAVIAFWLALRADVLIVSRLVSKHDVGIYSLAVTLAEVILLASDALALTALGLHPRLDREQSYTYSVEVGAGAARVAALQVVALAGLGWPLILVAYGRAWLETYPVVIALAPGMIAVAYMRPVTVAFIRAGRALERSLVMVVAGLANIVGTLIATVKFGIVGAGVASTIAYALGALLLAWRLRVSLGASPWARTRLRVRRPLQRASQPESPLGEAPTPPS